MDLFQILKTNEADAVLVTDPYNMQYISGFSGGEGYVYFSANRAVIITDSRYTEATDKEKKDGFVLEECTAKRSSADILKELYEKDKPGVIGFEDGYVTYGLYGKLCKAFDGAMLKGLGEALNDLRIIKTPEELDRLRMAEHIGDLAFEHILKVIKPGITELEIAAELEYAMKKNGAVKLSFDTIVASGYHSSMPHAVPTDKKVSEGEFITMDFGCIYESYCSDMTRTVVCGKADEDMKRMYETVLNAQLTSIKAIHSGVRGCDIHNIAAGIIDDAGYKGYFGHGLGHSVGMYIHENPRFSSKDDSVIMAGTIETVEPGIYIPGNYGVRIEDMGVVTETGYDDFAHSPKELIEL